MSCEDIVLLETGKVVGVENSRTKIERSEVKNCYSKCLK